MKQVELNLTTEPYSYYDIESKAIYLSFFDKDRLEQTLTHETIHKVLYKLGLDESSSKFDNQIKPDFYLDELIKPDSWLWSEIKPKMGLFSEDS